MPRPRLQFNVCKTSGRLRPGQVIECEAGAALDGAGQVPGRLLTGVPGPLKYYARFLPVPRVYADNTARALAVLGHPNVVGPIGVGGTDGDVFLVQELPEGDVLERWIQRSRTTGVRLTLREVEQVLRHAATALRHAHQAQIRHGSLGSSQVRVARQGSDLVVQVVDFGVLPLLAAHSPAVSVHEWHQLSPEQAESPANATVASDLFSLGVLLAELLTGYALVPPSAKMPWRELAVARPPDVRATIARERPDAPDAVLDLAASLLRARPDDRSPATAMDLARLLPRLSWEPRVAPPTEDARAAQRNVDAPPPAVQPRPATLAPSRNFVVSGASYSKPAAAAPPVAPQPPAPLDDATLSEASPLAMQVAAPSPPPRSWFTNEETVVSAHAPDLDETMIDGERDDAAPDGTQIVAMPRRREARPSPSQGFFRPEGTMVLAHPDQLASPREDDASTWDGTRALEAPPPDAHDSMADATGPLPTLPQLEDATAPVPVLAAPVAPAPPAPANLPFTLVAIESTMPDTSVPVALRAPPAAGPPPRASDPMTHTIPLAARATTNDPGAHPALIALVVVAAGAVLGLILWGVLHS